MGRFSKEWLRQGKRQVKAVLGPVLRKASTQWSEIPPAAWGLKTEPDGQLSLDGLPLPSLLHKWGTPLHVVHAPKLRQNIERFLSQTPQCEVFYSYKTNPIPGVLRQMHALGVGAEVISPYELWLALRLEVPPEKIIYNGPAKSDESIRLAVEKDILLLNVNHREEVDRVVRIARELGKKPRVGIRVGTSLGWAGQFGTAIASGEAFETFQAAVASGALHVCALHSHLGQSLRSEATLLGFLDEVLALTSRLRRELSVELDMLDLGGSLATPTVAWFSATAKRWGSVFSTDPQAPDPSATLSIERYLERVCERVAKHAAQEGCRPPRILLEPGRAMTANTQMLLSTVITVKESVEPPSYAVLDAGINLAESMRAEFHQLFLASRMHAVKERTYRLAGPICSPGDIIRDAWTTAALREGDCVAIMDAGAYFVPFATSFSFPQPAIVVVDNGKVALLRRAERYEDLIALDV